MSIAMHGVDTHRVKFVALHGVKLHAQWYTKFMLIAIHGLKLYAQCYS